MRGKLRGGFGSMTVVQTCLSYLSLIPFVSRIFFEFVDGKPSVVISYFFRYSFFFAAEAHSGTKRTAQFFLFPRFSPHSFNTKFFFAESAPKIDSFYGQEKWGVVRGKKDPFTLENCGHTAFLYSSAHTDFP